MAGPREKYQEVLAAHEEQVNRLNSLRRQRTSGRPTAALQDEIAIAALLTGDYQRFLNAMTVLLAVIESQAGQRGRPSNEYRESITRLDEIYASFRQLQRASQPTNREPVPARPTAREERAARRETERQQPDDTRPPVRRRNRPPEPETAQESGLEESLADQVAKAEFESVFGCSQAAMAAYAEKFERTLASWKVEKCSVCFELSDSIVNTTCSRCAKYPVIDQLTDSTDLATVNPFGPHNNMYPGDVPEELKGLTMIERILISPIKPIVQVFSLTPNGQRGYRGQIINFESNLTSFVTELPHALSNLSEILIVRKPNSDPSLLSEFRVRKHKVFNALRWLINNNVRFRNRISISDANLNLLPYDDSVSSQLRQVEVPAPVRTPANTTAETDSQVDAHAADQDADLDYLVSTGVFDNVVPNIRNQINELLNIEEPYQVTMPALNPRPVNELTAGYLALAYPCCYPYGNADINDERLVPVSTIDYIRHCLLLSDSRFIDDERFRYHGSNLILRSQALKKGRIFIERNSELRNMSADQLKEALLQNPVLYNKVLCYNSNLRSTCSYWHARSKELEAMVKQLGPPTLFFTLSAADLQWPELFRVLGMSRAEFDRSTNGARQKLLNKNPHLTAWFFQKRAKVFIKEVLFKHLNVVDFWFRVEFQHRGSVHLHGFVWLDGAPQIARLDRMNEAERQGVVDYFDKLVCASNNNYGSASRSSNVMPCKMNYSDIPTNQAYQHIVRESPVQQLVSQYLEDYHNLINKVQKHTRCSASCLRRKRGVFKCRFKFPKDLQTSSRIVLNEETGRFELLLKRNDPRLNNHMPFISVLWRANIDVTPIVSVEAVVRYIAKYAKHEPLSNAMEEMRQHLTRIQTENRTTTSLVQSILLKQCAMRDYCSQETYWIIAGHPFFESSRRFQTLHLSRNAHIPLESRPDDSPADPEQSYSNRLVNFDVARRGPQASRSVLRAYRADHLDQVRRMSLHEFFSTYYKRTVNAAKWSVYDKSPILRIFPNLQTTTSTGDVNQEYYKLQLKITVPWHTDFESSINPDGLPWFEVYQQYQNAVSEELVALDVDLSSGSEPDQLGRSAGDVDLHEWQLFARESPNSPQPAAELGLREQDTVDWSASYHRYVNHNEIRNFVQTQVDMQRLNQQQLTDEISMPQVLFSPEQQRVLATIGAMVHFVETGEKLAAFRQSLIIQGKAGSGKSTLIKAIQSIVSTRLGRGAITTMAPTGAAASNINCSTIHSTLKINIHRTLTDLSNSSLHELQQVMRECKFIVIDEMSLLGCSLLKKIDIRCRESKGVNDLEFGGMFLVLIGDLRQLPPVKDRPFFGTGFDSPYADEGQQLFRSIDASIILRNSHRQAEDQLEFKRALDNLSDGKFSVAEWLQFCSRNIDRIPDALDFRDAVRLFDTNAKAKDFNYLRMSQFPSVYRLRSFDNCEESRRASAKLADNLEPVLYLAVGSKVMLRRNLWISAGLVNGAISTITDIVLEPDGDAMPLFVMIAFERYSGPRTFGDSVPIAPVESRFTSRGQNCKRVQLPISTAFGFTVHKSQGKTLLRAVADVGDSENSMSLGMAYVGFSRTTTFEGLAIKPYDYGRFAKIADVPLLRLRRLEDARLETIQI